MHAGNTTLPAPVTQIETLNSTRIRVSWQPISTGQPIRYFVVLYNGDLIEQHPAGASTFRVVDGLDHLDVFIAIVVAVSGNAYGAAYRIFVLEAGMQRIHFAHTCIRMQDIHFVLLYSAVSK